jgi:hypothetical protein
VASLPGTPDIQGKSQRLNASQENNLGVNILPQVPPVNAEGGDYPADWDDIKNEADEARKAERQNILKNVRGVTFDSLARAVGRDVGDVTKFAVAQGEHEVSAVAGEALGTSR